MTCCNNQKKGYAFALSTIDDNVWEYHFPTQTMNFAVNEKSILELNKTVFEGKENLVWWQTILEEDQHIAIDTFRQYMNGEITKHCVEYRSKTERWKNKMDPEPRRRYQQIKIGKTHNHHWHTYRYSELQDHTKRTNLNRQQVIAPAY